MRARSMLGFIMFSTTIAGTVTAAPVKSHPPASTAKVGVAKVDEATVKDIIINFCDSWTKHDMVAMHAHVTPDVEWINVVGNDWRGAEQVWRGHANYHHFLAAKSSCSVESVAVRPISSDALITVTVFHFAGQAPDGKPEDAHTRSSMIMVKRSGEWKIDHMQNTIINPATQGPADPLNFDETTGLPHGAK